MAQERRQCREAALAAMQHVGGGLAGEKPDTNSGSCQVPALAGHFAHPSRSFTVSIWRAWGAQLAPPRHCVCSCSLAVRGADRSSGVPSGVSMPAPCRAHCVVAAAAAAACAPPCLALQGEHPAALPCTQVREHQPAPSSHSPRGSDIFPAAISPTCRTAASVAAQTEQAA